MHSMLISSQQQHYDVVIYYFKCGKEKEGKKKNGLFFKI